MVQITKKTMSKSRPNVINIGVNQQVNDRIAAYFGRGAHFIANAI